MQFNELVSEFTPGAAGVWTVVMMIGVYMAREWRENRKLSSDDRLALREGYTKRVEGLEGENRNLREDLVKLEERHEQYRKQCHQETDALRNRVVDLEDRLTGAFRKMADVAIKASRGEIDAAMAASILQLASEVEPERGRARLARQRRDE